MNRAIREFESRAQVVSFLADTLGAAEVTRDDSGVISSAAGSYEQHGNTYFLDGETGVLYAVRDALLAHVGGAHGIVVIGGEELCVDPDRECDHEEFASYLAPDGVLTSPHVDYIDGANGARLTFTSFYNWTVFPWPWARHGSNVILNVAAESRTRLSTGGYLVGPGYTAALVGVANEGQQSVEAAHWTAFAEPPPAGGCASLGCYVWNATAVCGTGSGDDPDVSGSRITQNGPTGSASCP